MATTKKLASLRLDAGTMDRIDAAMTTFYRQAGGVPPSRNAQLESWVTDGLTRMEARIRPAQAPAGAEGEAQ